MTCDDCGQVVYCTVRQFRRPKRGRGRGRVRDVCEPCYRKGMKAAGYQLRQAGRRQWWVRPEATMGEPRRTGG